MNNLCLEKAEELPINATYRVASCQKLGRYLVAGRNLHKGEIIFQEEPLASAPQKNSVLICPGCYGTPKIKCQQCNWLICGEHCPALERHNGNECQVIKCQNLQNKNRSEVIWIALQGLLILFRCINLKLKDAIKWEELGKMETLWEDWSKSPLFESALELVDQLRNYYGITNEQCSNDEILKVLAALDINAYEIKMPEANVQGCYKLASLAEHDCLPNSFKTTSSNSLLLTLRALTDIREGEHISTNYCDILQTTSQRQRHLQWSKFFVCQCQRCTSETELDSFISSFLCPNCPINLMSPLTPILTQMNDTIIEDEEEEQIWKNTYKDYKCIKCEAIFPAHRCESFMILAEGQLQELDKQCTLENSNVPDFEAWLEHWTIFPAAKNPLEDQAINSKITTKIGPCCKRRRNIKFSSTPLIYLHPQHALSLDACHTLFLLYSAESSSMEELMRKNYLGIHLLQATDKLIKGISLFRGTVMYELAMTKTSLLAKYLEPEKIKPKEDMKNLAKEIMLLLTESLDHLSYESQDQPEGKLFVLGLKQFEEIKELIAEIVPDL